MIIYGCPRSHFLAVILPLFSRYSQEIESNP